MSAYNGKERKRRRAQHEKNGQEPSILELEDDYKPGFDRGVTARLFSYLIPHRRKLSLAIATMFLSVFANVISPPLIGWAIDEGIENRDMSVVIFGVLTFIVVQVGGLSDFASSSAIWQLSARRSFRRFATSYLITFNICLSTSSPNTRLGD